eukprot:TRINITY_DN2303_c0_g1_i10.p1 TRINITY_DN2303_c0_g1~~TRINITY_DN2303_c0_g1_i10.p1  ORF type:complete len:763 (-),score=152.81 TRINITY_DN2303_c0_g1_i10:140-2428(-)
MQCLNKLKRPLFKRLSPLLRRHYSNLKVDNNSKVWDELGTPPPAPSIGLWVNHIYPFSTIMGWLRDGLTFVLSVYDINPKSLNRKDNLVLQTLEKEMLTPLRVIPRIREGGFYVYFPDHDTAVHAYNILSNKKRVLRQRIGVHIVHGEPFIEDIVQLKASPKIQVELPSSTNRATVDDIFEMFRPYGKILDIEVNGNIATVLFLYKESAISARNCMYNMDVRAYGGNILINFVPYSRWKIGQFISNAIKSPKLLPLLLFILLSVLLLLIEPVRLYNVCTTLGRVWHENNLPPINLRPEEENQLKEILQTQPASIIFVTGPPGSGKTTLVSRVVNNRPFAIRIVTSSDKTMSGTIEDVLIEHLEDSIGFSPSFSAINTIWSFIEGLFPSKTALYSSKLAQLDTLLSTLQKALSVVSLISNVKTKPVIVFDRFHDLVDKFESQPDDMKKKAYVLIEGLLKWSVTTSYTNQSAHIIFVADWNTVEKLKELDPRLRGLIRTFQLNDITEETAKNYLSNTYQVETSEKTNYLKTMSMFKIWDAMKQLANRSNYTNNLSDTMDNNNGDNPSLCITKRSSIMSDNVKTSCLLRGDEVDYAYSVVGGRPEHLSALKSKIIRGESLQEALEELMMETQGNVLTNGLGKDMNTIKVGDGVKWNKIQLWRTMLSFSNSTSLQYYQLFEIFEGNSVAILDLVKSKFLEMKSIKTDDKYTINVEPSSPLLLYTYRQIIQDPTLTLQMKRIVRDYQIEKILKDIKATEDEMYVFIY